MVKEDPRLQGLCKECAHRNSCPDAKRYLNMIGCSDYKHWKKGYTKNTLGITMMAKNMEKKS